jgi:hypothetical protein
MSRTALVALTGLTVVLVAACGSSTSGGTPTPSTAATAPPTTAPTAAPTPTPTAAPTLPPATVGVTGSWSGQYSGPFNGTFTLAWTQTGSHVDGTIILSSPPDTLNINGTLSGSAISFGAVGVVTYSGTVSGNSMSGSYKDLANGQTGSWSASKS